MMSDDIKRMGTDMSEKLSNEQVKDVAGGVDKDVNGIGSCFGSCEGCNRYDESNDSCLDGRSKLSPQSNIIRRGPEEYQG